MLRRIFSAFLFLLLFPSCSSQQSVLLERTADIENKKTLDYYLFLPEGYSKEKARDFGLLLFLHGGGESGGVLSDVRKHGPPKMMADGYPFPFLVLAPQNPYKKKFWDIWTVKELLDQVIEETGVDPRRIYLTGLSRGGSAAWELAVQFPDQFAAMAVVCGMTPVPYVNWLDKEMPIWMFHGVDDEVIPIGESDAMYEAVKKRGMQVIYDRYPDTGHNAWDKAYATEGLFDWLNRQKRKDEK